MPTRFPAGLNCGIQKSNPLYSLLSAPTQAGEWGVYYEDFQAPGNFVTLASGAAGSASITSVPQEADGSFGNLILSTNAGTNDIQAAYVGSFAVNTPSTPYILGGSSASNDKTSEWVFSTRVRMSNAAMGFWIGLASSSAIYSAGPVDLTPDAVVGAVVNGIYFHKAISTTSIYADLRGNNQTRANQVTMTTAADAGVIGLVAHLKGTTLTYWISAMNSAGASVWTRVSQQQTTGLFSTSGAMGLTMGAKAESASQRTLTIDNVLFARRSKIGR